MAGKERENFCRNAILIVDHAKDSLVDVLELHLTLNSLSFEEFINLHQHDIYHLCYNKKWCCQCSRGYVPPYNKRVLHPSQLEILLDKKGVSSSCHCPIGPADFCCCLAKPGVTTNVLDITLARCLLINFCNDVFRRSSSLQNNIDTLLQMRNNVYGHAKEARITDVNYRIYKNEIGSAILEIAKVCGNETEKSQILMDLEKLSLDKALCRKYQNTLLEWIARDKKLEEKFDELAEKIPEIVENAVVKAFDGDRKQKLTKDQQIRKEKLKEDTRICIQTHITEKTFVKTNLISEGLQKLNENGIVILTGIPGIGKSRNSLELLDTFCTENQYSAIWLQSRSEWSELINADDNLIVLIDDVFGRTNSTFDGNEDIKLLDIIYSTIQKGTVKVILTMRNTIKVALFGVGDSHRMLKDVNFLDISSDRLQMTTDEKEKCLLNYCKKNNITLASSTQKINSDGSAILDSRVHEYLSWEQIRDIAKINVCPLLGFPESCYLFASNRKFTGQGVAFFKHPTQALCDEISSIRTSGRHDDSKALEYVILVYIMLNGDCFDRSKINCEKVKQIIESIYDPSSIKLTTTKMENCVELLTGRYLKLKEDNTVCFQHRTIFESVLLSYKDVNPKLVIPLLDKDCLLELGCLEKYKPESGEVTFKFYSKSYKQLASQLVTYLKLALNPFDFIQTLCSSRIIRYADKSMLEELHNAYKNGKLGVYIRMRWLVKIHCYYASEDVQFTLLAAMLKYSINFPDNTNVIIHILDLISKEMNVDSTICVKERYTRCFTYAFLQSCASNDVAKLNAILNFIKTKHIKLDEQITLWFHTKSIQVDMFELLVPTVKDCALIDVNVLMQRVVDFDDVSLVNVIINQYDCKSYDIQSAMDTACKNGSVNIVRWFCEHFGISVFDMQSLMLTVCERGHIEIVKLLLDKLDHKMFDLDAAMNKSLLLTVCEHGHIEIVKLLLDKLEHKQFDIDAAMNKSLLLTVCEHGHIEIVKLLLDKLNYTMFDLDAVVKPLHHFSPNYFDIMYVIVTNTKHSSNAKRLMRTIQYAMMPSINYEGHFDSVNRSHFILVKYLLETHNIVDFDLEVVIEIACSSRDSDILQCVLQMMDINDFYQIWIKAEHLKNHRTMVLEKLFGSGCCNDKDVLTLMNTEMKYGTVDGIKYLMEKFDWRYFDIKTVIEYSFNYEWYRSDLMLWMLQTFGYNRFDMRSILEMALKHEKSDLVEWILVNIDAKMFDIKLVIQSVTRDSKLSWLLEKIDLQSIARTYTNISLVRSVTDRFGIEMFQSRHIMPFAIRNLENGSSDIVKLCLKNPLNIGECDMIELFNIACRQHRTELIEWLLVNYDHVHFHFNSAITEALDRCSLRTLETIGETLKWSVLKTLLIKLDHTFLDIESIIQNFCRKREFDIVMWMLDTFHPHLADIRSVMSMACQHGELHLVQCIIRQYGGIRMFNIETIFDDACKSKSSSLLEWLYQEFENPHICNLNNFCNYSFRNIIFLIENRKINSSDYNTIFNHFFHKLNLEIYIEFLICLLDITDHRLFDLKLVFNHVCLYGTTNLVKWMMDAFDHTLFDFQSAILEAVQDGNFELVTFLLNIKPVKKLNFDVNSVFLEACYYRNAQLVNWLLDNFDNTMFSVSEGISRSCSTFRWERSMKNSGFGRYLVIEEADDRKLLISVIKRLMEIADTSKVDVQFVMHQACDCPRPDWDFVKFMFTTYDYKIFDMKLIFNSACHTGTPEIVKWLLDHFDRGVFDLKSGFNEACCECKLDIVKLLVESVGTEIFDLQSALQLTMNNDKFYWFQNEIVKYLLNKIQPSVSDLQCVMDKMFPRGNTVFVKWFIKSFDCSKLDINSTIGRSFDKKHYCLKVLELLLQSFDHERFDMMLIIILANHKGYREFVSMVIKTVDHAFFDMKTVLLEICKGGDLETVMYLIETCHCEDLVDEAFILNAFRTGSSDIVKWLLHKRKGEIIDTKTAMSNACIGGHTQLVQYLLVKYNVKHFDLRSYINVASYYGRTEVVQYILQVFHYHNDYERFNMHSVMYHARASGHVGLVKWLLGVCNHEIFNIESSVIEDVKNEMAKMTRKPVS